MLEMASAISVLAFFAAILPTLQAAVVVSVLYDKSSGSYQIVDGRKDSSTAWGSFSDEVSTTGWSFLEVHTNGSFDDSVQSYSAGIIEGYLTAEFILTDWFNRGMNTYCSDDPVFCINLKKFLAANKAWIDDQMKSGTDEEYWYQVKLVYDQLDGLEEGYNQNPKVTKPLGAFDFMLIQLFGDLDDLSAVLKGKRKHVVGSGSCSALIKLLPSAKDLFISQVTWNDFVSMLRIYKLYNFELHTTTNTGKKIASQNQSFSSYPGLLMSGDDFYMLSSGLVSQETTIGNSNKDLLKYIQPETVMEWLRTIVANRLATSGGEWTFLFSKFNSGTYNNQWMVLDYKLFTPGMPFLKPGTFWVLEQIPGMIEMADVTVHLQNNGYWASYNIPYFPLIYNMSGVTAAKEQYGPWFDYNQNPRAQIFKRDHHNVVDMDTMMKMMRYNDFKNDPISKCNCTPPYSAENAISARSDLNPSNGTYPFAALGHRRHGGTDAKITNSEMFKTFSNIAVSGPTNDQQPAFQWSISGWKKPDKHPDKWEFKPVVVKWEK